MNLVDLSRQNARVCLESSGQCSIVSERRTGKMPGCKISMAIG